jgi:hypothetical protein
MAITKNHKAFRWVAAMPIDANNILLEQAFARFLVLVRTKGRPITSTTKDTLHPEDLVRVVIDDHAHFQGVDDDSQRRRLLEHWLASEFTTCIKAGMGHLGKERIANLKPIHMSTIKLLDPRIRSQDRDLSQFLYNVFRESDLIIGENSLLMPFLTKGTTPFGEHDLKISESEARSLDVETLFLLRLLEHFKTDLPDNKKRVPPHTFLCPTTTAPQRHCAPPSLQGRHSAPRTGAISHLPLLVSCSPLLHAVVLAHPQTCRDEEISLHQMQRNKAGHSTHSRRV